MKKQNRIPLLTEDTDFFVRLVNRSTTNVLYHGLKCILCKAWPIKSCLTWFVHLASTSHLDRKLRCSCFSPHPGWWDPALLSTLLLVQAPFQVPLMPVGPHSRGIHQAGKPAFVCSKYTVGIRSWRFSLFRLVNWMVQLMQIWCLYNSIKSVQIKDCYYLNRFQEDCGSFVWMALSLCR